MPLLRFLQILTLFILHTAMAQNSGEWKYAGPFKQFEQVKGLIKAVYMDPLDSNFVLAGGGSAGLFKSENALNMNSEWNNISDTYRGVCFGVSDIVVIPETQRKTIYIATSHQSGLPKAYGNGILMTEDGGKTWKEVGPKPLQKHFLAFEGLVANRQNYKEMIAYSSSEVFFTKDGWNTFETIIIPTEKSPEISFCDAEFAPYEPGKFYVSTRFNNKADARLYICENYGKKITDITPSDAKGYRIEVATMLNPKYQGKFYIAYGAKEAYVKYFDGKMFSKNLNKEAVVHAFGNAYWCFELSVNEVDTNIIYLSMTETSRSDDGGKTFRKLNYYNAHNTHADVRAMSLVKSTIGGKEDVLLIGNDGGVSFINSYSPPLWRSLNGEGLDANQFWGVSVYQSDTLFIAGGTQDNGGFIITKDTTVNTMYNCGDGYLAMVVDHESAIIECNAPLINYHNIKTHQQFPLRIPDKMFEGRRPLINKDSMFYFGFHDLWSISKSKLKSGKIDFKNESSIPLIPRKSQGNHNAGMRSADIGLLNSAVVCYAYPNWEDENIGKIFFNPDFKKLPANFIDITKLLVYESFELCKWSEISAVEMDHKDPYSFLIVSRDQFDQSNSKIYRAKYIPDSATCMLENITSNLPKLGINKIKTDRFSGITYLAIDDGVYYANLSNTEIFWKKLATDTRVLPSVSVTDIDFNYYTNTLYAATYGRGIWQTKLVSSLSSKVIVKTNRRQKEFQKIDGYLMIKKGKTFEINSPMMFTRGSVIELSRNSKIIVTKKSFIRNENNQVIPIETLVKPGKKFKIVFLEN
jgi:hypothetical protein